MSKPNKYYQHVSQEPTEGDPNSRAYKRRKHHDSWENYYVREGMNYHREIRRKAWKWAWPKFRDLKVKEVIG